MSLLMISISLYVSNCRKQINLVPLGNVRLVDYVHIVGETEEGHLIIKNEKGEIEEGHAIVTKAFVWKFYLMQEELEGNK